MILWLLRQTSLFLRDSLKNHDICNLAFNWFSKTWIKKIITNLWALCAHCIFGTFEKFKNEKIMVENFSELMINMIDRLKNIEQ